MNYLKQYLCAVQSIIYKLSIFDNSQKSLTLLQSIRYIFHRRKIDSEKISNCCCHAYHVIIYYFLTIVYLCIRCEAIRA